MPNFDGSIRSVGSEDADELSRAKRIAKLIRRKQGLIRTLKQIIAGKRIEAEGLEKAIAELRKTCPHPQTKDVPGAYGSKETECVHCGERN